MIVKLSTGGDMITPRSTTVSSRTVVEVFGKIKEENDVRKTALPSAIILGRFNSPFHAFLAKSYFGAGHFYEVVNSLALTKLPLFLALLNRGAANNSCYAPAVDN